VIENAVFAFKQPPTLMRHITVTCVIVTLTVLTSLLTDCVGIVLELNVSHTTPALARFTRSNSTTSGKPKLRENGLFWGDRSPYAMGPLSVLSVCL